MSDDGTAACVNTRNHRGGLLRSGWAVWILAAVAVLGLIIGYVLGGVVLSPKQAQAPTPVEGLMTAKVEARQITGTVVGRADVAFADRVEVRPPVPTDAVSAVVTGHVPTVGATVNAGDVVLEVSGQPVFVLPGAFGSYRALGAGSSGADVTQLRAALSALGVDAGAESASYDGSLAQGVRALYERAGYAAPDGGDAAAQAVRLAQDSVTDATSGVTQATSAVAQAEKAAKRARADQSALQKGETISQSGQMPTSEGQSGGDAAVTKAALQQAADAVEQADLAVQQAKDGLATAQRGVTRAEEALADAQRGAWATVPVGAVVFVPDLPRRIDEVNVVVGTDLAALSAQAGAGQSGASASVAPVVLSGAQIVVTAQVGMDEAALLVVGGGAVLTVPAGGTAQGQISSICDLTSADRVGADDSGGAAGSNGAGGAAVSAATARCAVGITLADTAGVNAADLVGNVQVTMVVGTSSPDSLIVPVAAVSADTAGHARVTVVDGQLEPGVAARDQKTKVVEVVTGLSAEGMVEIVSATPMIAAGDLVVIGQGASQASSDETPR